MSQPRRTAWVRCHLALRRRSRVSTCWAALLQGLGYAGQSLVGRLVPGVGLILQKPMCCRAWGVAGELARPAIGSLCVGSTA